MCSLSQLAEACSRSYSGYTGLQLLTQIIIADVTSLKWRGLVSGLISLPFVVNAFVGTKISTSLNLRGDWRWGCKILPSPCPNSVLIRWHIADGMFAILVPATLSPLIVVLIWADRKAKKTGLLVRRPTTKTIPQRFMSTCSKLDVVGLFILAACVALILLPLTLSRKLGKGWQSGENLCRLVRVFS
jgi:MFS family permease